MTIQVTPNFETSEVYASVTIPGVVPTDIYGLQVCTGVDKILNPNATGGFDPVKIMNLDEYLSYSDINFTVYDNTTGAEIESDRHVPLPITAGLAVALVARNGAFLGLPGMAPFASNLAISKLAYQTSGNAIIPYIPAGFRNAGEWVSGNPIHHTGGRGKVASRKYKKNPNYVGNPMTKEEKNQIDSMKINDKKEIIDGDKNTKNPRVGTQFNIFSKVVNGDPAPITNSPTIVGIGVARVNDGTDPAKKP